MAITSKTQLQTDITASTFTAPQKTILGNIVDSYENVFPQLTTVQRDALTPTNGLVVYNTDTDTYQYWNGVAWFGIGQDLSTPLVVKVDLSSAEILALDATAKIVAVAAGAGYALIPTQVVSRFTYGSAQYAGSFNIVLKATTVTTSNPMFLIDGAQIKAAANRSSLGTVQTSSAYNAIIENDSLELKSTGAITTGDGTLTVWVTYSIIVW